MKQSILRYKLSHETYGVAVSQVLKILEIGPITPVPNAPAYLLGVLNWRGSILPVVDFNLKLGFPNTVISRDSCILVFELDLPDSTSTIGCLVDEVQAVMEVDTEQLLESPSIGDKYKSELIEGMYPEEKGFIIMLDYQQIFSTEKLLELSKNSISEHKKEIKS